jgi:hypothetical protein
MVGNCTFIILQAGRCSEMSGVLSCLSGSLFGVTIRRHGRRTIGKLKFVHGGNAQPS